MKTSRIVRVNERGEIVTGQRYCYQSRAAALKASQGATTAPRVSWWGKGGIVRVVDV